MLLLELFCEQDCIAFEHLAVCEATESMASYASTTPASNGFCVIEYPAYRVVLYQSVQSINRCYLAAASVEYTVYTIDIWRTDILDAIMEVDGNCNIKQANKDASTMFGFPVAGLKTLNLSRLFHLAGTDH